MRIPAVLDSTCLIGFERLGRFDLLPTLLDPIFVPPAVHREFGSLPPGIQVVTPTDVGMVATLRLLVDPGESEAIALAYERRVRIILDDRKAREVAQKLGLAVTGTVGLLVRAKLNGDLPSLRPLLDELESKSFRIGEALRAEALRLVGE